MPLPASVTEQSGFLPITTSFSVSTSGVGASDGRVQLAVVRLFSQLSRQTGMLLLPHTVPADEHATLSVVVEGRAHKGPQKLGDNEQYSLAVTPEQVRLSADEPLGVLRGMETLLQLVQQTTTAPGENVPRGFAIPAVTIHDGPRFPWRGLSLDVSRHFIPVDGVKRTIDGLAAVKMNVLHWHLSDDQGFRVESKRYPRLQQFGSDGQYYTQSDLRDVIAYARDRGIRIVPEFDIPGHATSWLPGYPKLAARSGSFDIARSYGILYDLMDPTKDSTYRFLDGFIGEMTKIFPDEYFHIGGDEVAAKQWRENPSIQKFMHKHAMQSPAQLQAYFNGKLLKIVTKYGKHMEGWDEVLEPTLPKSIVIQSWRGQASLWQAAREGYSAILSAGYYVDLSYPASYHYAVDPMKDPPPAPTSDGLPGTPKPGAPAAGTPADLTPEQAKRVLGGEAAMWEELASSENVDSRLWPRLAAIAERFWSPETVTDTTSMYARLQQTSLWLEWVGLTHRTSLELMRQRLMGTESTQSLDRFASVLEPVKGYSRHANKYAPNTPLNRLVDAVPPESDDARRFRADVDTYLAGPHDAEHSAALRKNLALWSANIDVIRPALQAHSLLNEDLPLADQLATLCRVALQSLDNLDAGRQASQKDADLAAVQSASERQADLLIRVAPGVLKLAEAVPKP